MRILITAGGTVTAQSVIKALRADSREHFIVAGDMDPLNATKAFVDGFEVLPPASAPNFADRCLDVIRQHRIELMIPLIVEREFLPLAQRRTDFSDAGCNLWVPAEETIRTIGDKLRFAEFLSRIGVQGPWTREYAPHLEISEFPVYLKPRKGSGSVGTQRIESIHSLHEAAKGRTDLIVQQAVSGPEFTVDCFAAEPGRVVAAIPRERILIKAGVSVKGRTYHHKEIEDLTSYVVEKSGIVGPANVQGMLCADGGFMIIEMNPRFSGTLALSTAAGINYASLLLDCVEGKPIPDLRGKHMADVSMMRYWQEVFESPDGVLWSGQDMRVRSTT
jgi:carbamoyl-phosphate synthase large subunit